MVPIKILDISNDNDDEKVHVDKLYRYFELEDMHIAKMQNEEESKQKSRGPHHKKNTSNSSI